MSDAASSSGGLPRLDVLVLNWNGRDLLGDCLGSLLADTHPNLHILMVDNASSDDSVSWCREHFPAVEILEAAENLRWAGGNNLGLAHLLNKPETEQILVLNNDTIMPAGALERLATAAAAEPRAWAATPRICYASRPDRIWYDGGRVGRYSGWIRHQGIRKAAAGEDLAERFVEYGTGCALLLKRSALERLPRFDTDFHFYGEDTDYCLRLRDAGGRVLHVPTATVLHKVSMSVGAGSPAKAYLKSRSLLRLLRRHWPRSRLPLLLPSQILFHAAQTGWHIGRGTPRAALGSLQGVFDELLDRPLRY